MYYQHFLPFCKKSVGAEKSVESWDEPRYLYNSISYLFLEICISAKVSDGKGVTIAQIGLV